jgi:hypothetical protein
VLSTDYITVGIVVVWKWRRYIRNISKFGYP